MKRKLIIPLVLAVSLCFVTSCGWRTQNSGEGNSPEPSPSLLVSDEDKVEIKVYYPNENGGTLEEQTIKVDEKDKYQAALQQCIENSSVLPKDLKILSVKVQDKTCTVDLSGEINQLKGSAATTMGVYTMVNSLCAFEEVDEVLFLVNGKKQMALDQMIFDEPFVFNPDIMQ